MRFAFPFFRKTIRRAALVATAGAALPLGTAIGERIAAASATGEPLKTIQVLPIGKIKSKRDGREWLIRDEAHAHRIVAASNAAAEPAQIPADYDHQLMFGAKDGVGGTAKASGWLSNLRVEGGFIVADPEWTDAATAMIKAKEYRYISPVFTFDGKTREIGRVLNVALTNFPAITELAAVASADASGDSMDLKALAACFGLAETATIEQIIAAANAQRAALATAAGLPATATSEEIATAVAAAKAGGVDPTKFAPISELQAVRAELKVLQDNSATAAATAAVDGAIAAGKVTPASREWAMSYATTSLEGFKAFLANAPVIGAVVTTATAKKPPETEAELTADQLAVCKATGVSPKAFLETLKEEIANGRA
jgi:phage I-like protein